MTEAQKRQSKADKLKAALAVVAQHQREVAGQDDREVPAAAGPDNREAAAGEGQAAIAREEECRQVPQ